MFEEITLLSEDEYLENKELIPSSRDGWWLRSPGHYKRLAKFVDGDDGLVRDYGGLIWRPFGVRPILKIRGHHDLIPGDKLKISEYTFTVLHGDLMLCDTCIGTSMFDYTSNNFKTSVIRKYLYNWAEENNITFEKP